MFFSFLYTFAATELSISFGKYISFKHLVLKYICLNKETNDIDLFQ